MFHCHYSGSISSKNLNGHQAFESMCLSRGAVFKKKLVLLKLLVRKVLCCTSLSYTYVNLKKQCLGFRFVVGTEKAALLLDFTLYLNMIPYKEKNVFKFFIVVRKLITAMEKAQQLE